MLLELADLRDAVVRVASSMGVGDWLAFYGAGLSTALGFREWRRRSRIKVKVSTGDIVNLETKDRIRCLRVIIVNRSDYPVRLISFGLYRRRQNFMFSRPNMVLPASIPAHDSVSAEFPVKTLNKSPDFANKRVRAWALLSTGETYHSSILEGVVLPAHDSDAQGRA